MNRKLHVKSPRLLFVSALILLCQMLPHSLFSSCPDEIPGFDYLGQINDHNYYLSQSEATWLVANDISLSLGGYLVTITSAEENAYILQSALDLGIVTTAHIGLSDYATEGTFVWTSSENLIYNNADFSFNDINKNNVSINLWQNGGDWVLQSKWVQTKFILELPCNEIIPDAKVEIEFYSCPTNFPTPGNIISLDVTVRNTDTIPSLPQTFGLYQSIAGEEPIADNLLGQGFVGPLNPNEVAVVTINNIWIPDPFYFPGFSMNDIQWGTFYVKRYTNISGTSLEPDFSNPPFNIFCQTYTTDISVTFGPSNNRFGDQGIVDYYGTITNNGPATAYNIKAIVGRTAHGSIPTITTIPYEEVLTYDDTDQTRVICIDELGVGESMQVDVYYDFENSDLPETFDVSCIAYSEHLIDTNNSNNSFTEVFNYDPDVSDDCPSTIAGFDYLGQYNSNRYFVSEAAVHWWEAIPLAIAAGGTLTSIETSAENNFLAGYLDDNAWIGMSDFEEEGTLVWANGEPNIYDNIAGSNGPMLDYLSINSWNGLWIFNRASDVKKFVMEVPCNIVPGAYADLTGGTLLLDTLSVAQETLLDFNFTLYNNGNSDAANEYANHIYLSTDPILSDDDIETGIIDFGFTEKESQFSVDLAVAIPWNMLLGTYYVILELDHDNIIVESDESNNIVVSNQMLEVTGNECTILPTVSDGNLNVVGIPQGNSVFILYGPASEIVSMYTCSYNCPGQIEVENLPDGDYSIAFYFFSDDWSDLICEAYPINLSIVFGDLAGMIEESETEFEREIPYELLSTIPIKTQQLYPNPADEYIVLSLENHFERAAQLEIYDINGRITIQKNIQLDKGINYIELDISNLAGGIHHIVIKSDNQVISTQRFVKSKL